LYGKQLCLDNIRSILLSISFNTYMYICVEFELLALYLREKTIKISLKAYATVKYLNVVKCKTLWYNLFNLILENVSWNILSERKGVIILPSSYLPLLFAYFRHRYILFVWQPYFTSDLWVSLYHWTQCKTSLKFTKHLCSFCSVK
jgi:hypothetical protein